MHDNVGVVDQKRSAVNAAFHSSYGSHLSGTAALQMTRGGGVGALWIWPYRSNTDANAAYVNFNSMQLLLSE